MPVSVRLASYRSDAQALVEVLQSNLPYRSHALFFPWLYRANPEGEALAWLAVDSATDRIVGVASAFPRCLYVSGAESRGYVLGDFCIAPEYRSLGLAVTLQRTCLEGLAAAGAEFVFDLPSKAMLAVYNRLQIVPKNCMVRHAKQLRLDRKIARQIPIRTVARGLSAFANAGLQWRENIPVRTGCKIALEPGPWGEEFTCAAKNWNTGGTISVARNAAYLNWRYFRHPQTHYEMLTARGQSGLRGYLVLHIDGDQCIVDDLVTAEDSVAGELLAETSTMARARGLQSLSVLWLSTHSRRHLLRDCGFHPRDSQQIVLLKFPLPHPGAGSDSGAASDELWYLALGDWDN